MLFLKGLIIGIGKIIPGVSGSMLAISLGVYQNLIDAINNFFKDIKKNSIFLSKICIGIIIAIIFFSKIIVKALKMSYIATMFLFIGLIIGSIKDINPNINKKDKIITIIVFTITLIFASLNISNAIIINNNFFSFIFFIFIGIIDAITMIIPGISGTATLMMLGAYDSIITTFSNIGQLSNLSENLKIVIPFGIGLLLGIFFTARLINHLFKYHKSKTYSAILGFTLSTIIIMCLKSFNSSYSIIELIISSILLIIGFIISKKLNKLSK